MTNYLESGWPLRNGMNRSGAKLKSYLETLHCSTSAEELVVLVEKYVDNQVRPTDGYTVRW